MTWRWDQGRLDYLTFDNLRKAAVVLTRLNGVALNNGVDPLREPLMTAVGLPFSPVNYRVWRNYGRVFKCGLLATSKNKQLATTDLCHQLGDSAQGVTVDEYLSYVVPRFYYPSPVFQGYVDNAPQQFPFCSVIKLLLARCSAGLSAQVTTDEIFDLLIGNEVTGSEPVAYYLKLTSSGYKAIGDEPRQLRELIVFVSQFEFLKWKNPKLLLDVDPTDTQALEQINNLVNPIITTRATNKDDEILSLGGSKPQDFNLVEISSKIYSEDTVFTEGKKVRVTHLRTERSRKLREFFYAGIEKPYQCDMCDLNVTETYPWVDKLLEVHHLLPLASPVRVENSGTSVLDLVGLCPTCHRSVHSYYRAWLKDHGLDDFVSYNQANEVYEESKQALRS